MKDLDAFKGFLKPKIVETQKNNHIIGYTRISSKQQLDNFSLQVQEKEIKAYAEKNNFILDDIIGGTYESASGDFSRKEFKRLYDLIKGNRKRPHAIAIIFINRFSRTGAGAISIVNELIEKLNVHLIETSTGLSTENLRDRTIIYHKLLEAMEENHERLERTMPGMRAFLLAGNWLGVAPFGYTTYGPRVVDFSLKRERQEIRINEKGKVLQKAWQWKLQGTKDSEIIKKMESLGVSITKQRLSDIWRNPFYCGVIINNLLDEPVAGNWVPMVTRDDFRRVQQIIRPTNGESYKVDNQNLDRPLSRFLICSNCGRPLTGYIVQSKGVHYYKCNSCKGVSFNANTTTRSINAGLNDTFIELLIKIELSDEHSEVLKQQLIKMFRYLNTETAETLIKQKQAHKEAMDRMDKLEERYLYDGLEKEIFERHKRRLEDEILNISQNIDTLENKISNHSEFIEKAIHISKNLSKYWESGDLETKERIQKTVFPSGLVIVPQKRSYLTKNMNALFELTNSISTDNEDEIKKKVGENTDLSCQVAGAALHISNSFYSYLFQ